MSTVINTIPNQASYSKRQRYEFEIFDKSIKEIENLFKQDINIHPIKRQKLQQQQVQQPKINIANSFDSQNNYTHQNERLDSYLKKNQKSDSYNSLFSINDNNRQHHQHQHHQHHQHQHQHQHHDELTKSFLNNQSSNHSKKLPIVPPSIINHIRLETGKKIDYYVNDISNFTLDDNFKNDLIYNEDGLFLQNDEIITNLINIIDSNKED
ncbi:hypothetical protein BN7_1736 [Wickerhamomyces ciferrii]|uniref:Uncharacterized protein n=1 Tax=Wickerhamomyces ciferrii (strain ATCC 14091 / BCRC 22168 / CBS 111 / JCM 3599 / NBRC 0793 / NRRL Y-1031 F-60-10) TaxID=1206466 RepID=K0KJ81_WICCF|nr:uncharacterized protein BN7_1736 [Wickerhamomyces ciferrii]CCH42192.1 hypothetical protein BN7_1736 [Wickerhamomyces ciferrii]